MATRIKIISKAGKAGKISGVSKIKGPPVQRVTLEQLQSVKSGGRITVSKYSIPKERRIAVIEHQQAINEASSKVNLDGLLLGGALDQKA